MPLQYSLAIGHHISGPQTFGLHRLILKKGEPYSVGKQVALLVSNGEGSVDLRPYGSLSLKDFTAGDIESLFGPCQLVNDYRTVLLRAGSTGDLFELRFRLRRTRPHDDLSKARIASYQIIQWGNGISSWTDLTPLRQSTKSHDKETSDTPNQPCLLFQSAKLNWIFSNKSSPDPPDPHVSDRERYFLSQFASNAPDFETLVGTYSRYQDLVLQLLVIADTFRDSQGDVVGVGSYASRILDRKLRSDPLVQSLDRLYGEIREQRVKLRSYLRRDLGNMRSPLNQIDEFLLNVPPDVQYFMEHRTFTPPDIQRLLNERA